MVYITSLEKKKEVLREELNFDQYELWDILKFIYAFSVTQSKISILETQAKWADDFT